MSLRAARIMAAAYLVLMVIFVTWPGMVPFSRIRPLVLGLPFSFAWVAAWVLGALFVLLAVDRVERRFRVDGDHGPEPHPEAEDPVTHPPEAG